MDDTSAGIDSELVESFDRRDIHAETVDDPLPADLGAVMPDIDVGHRWDGWCMLDTGNVSRLAIE